MAEERTDGHSPRGSILFLALDPEAPSFRHRMLAAIPYLEARGRECRVERVPRGRYLVRIVERRRQLQAADVLVLAKLRPSPVERPLLRRWSRRIVFDFDDAIYLRRPRSLGSKPDRSWFRRYKFGQACRTADLVIAGNPTLAAAARRWTSGVEIVPTPVDAARHSAWESAARLGHTVVWIGMPENVTYLDQLQPVLGRLAADYPELRLRIISSRFPNWTELPVERLLWSPASEAEQLETSGIGVMPLSDDAWTRGKCAFKLLQYMAAGLPCVASDVGANREVVEHGGTGFLARSDADWEQGLRALLDSAELRRRLGAAGRQRVLRDFDRAVVVPRMAELIDPPPTSS